MASTHTDLLCLRQTHILARPADGLNIACWKSFLVAIAMFWSRSQQLTSGRVPTQQLTSGRVPTPERRRRKAIVDADIASSIQPNARAVIASSIFWATPFSTPGFLRLISCNVSAATFAACSSPPFRAARRSSRAHLERWALPQVSPPSARMARNLRGQKAFAKGPGESPRACSRSVPQVSNGCDAQTPRVPAAFSLGRLLRPLIDRVNAPNRPRAGGYPPYTLLLLAALLLGSGLTT